MKVSEFVVALLVLLTMIGLTVGAGLALVYLVVAVASAAWG